MNRLNANDRQIIGLSFGVLALSLRGRYRGFVSRFLMGYSLIKVVGCLNYNQPYT